MGGKTTNILIGISNILLGLVIIILEIYVLKYGINFSKYQNKVIENIRYGLNIFIIVNILINMYYAFVNKEEKNLSISYLIIILLGMYLTFNNYIIGIFGAISGIFIIFFAVKKRYIESESITAISVTFTLMIISMSFLAVIFSNEVFANKMYIKDMKGIEKYNEESFKLIEPLDIKEAYINIGKDSKYGYINKKGETVIAYDYDFATPFYKVQKFNKEYILAGVTKNNITEVILKNKRTIFSYKSEFEIYDYTARIKEFENKLKENLQIKDIDMQLEINKIFNNFIKKAIYKEDEKDKKNWTYRFDFNQKYDLLVIKSYLTNKEKYELALKTNLNSRIELDAEYLVYDNEYLYVYTGDNIPFFSPKEKIQGYFESTGNRKKLEGNAQIIEVEEDRILIKNYAAKSSYFIDLTGKEVSPIFKEVVVDNVNNRYVIKNNNDKWTIINKDLERVIPVEFDVFKPELLSQGLYIFANLENQPELNKYNYAKINYMVLNSEGKTVSSNISLIHNLAFKYPFNEIKEPEFYNFVEYIKRSNVEYAGDKYYNPKYNPIKNIIEE